MHLVEKIDALDADVVVLGAHHIRVVLKFLDIDHGDFRFAGVVVQHLRGLDVAGKGIAAIDGVHDQPAAGKLTLRLGEQVDPVDDEVELGDDALALEVVGEKTGVVIGQRGFAAALGVPDDALAYAGIEFPFNRLGGEELRVAHDVLVQAVGLVHIGQAQSAAGRPDGHG